MFMRIIFVLLTALALGAGAEVGKPKVISRGEAAGTYQAFPDVCRLANGELLCVFYGGYEHISLAKEGWPKGGRLCMGRSQDEGQNPRQAAIPFYGPLHHRDPSVAPSSDWTIP